MVFGWEWGYKVRVRCGSVCFILEVEEIVNVIKREWGFWNGSEIYNHVLSLGVFWGFGGFEWGKQKVKNNKNQWICNLFFGFIRVCWWLLSGGGWGDYKEGVRFESVIYGAYCHDILWRVGFGWVLVTRALKVNSWSWKWIRGWCEIKWGFDFWA